MKKESIVCLSLICLRSLLTVKFSEVKAYPNIANDYAYTLPHMKKLSFDIWLASRASQFNLQPGDAYNPMAFIDRAGYDAALAKLQNDYDKKIKIEED